MKLRTYLLVFLILSPMCFAQELNIKRFKSAIRQEQAKTPITMSLDARSNAYVSTGGIYKSIAKPITEKMPFGFEFDGKHMSFEPLSITWDTGETAVAPSKALSTMTKTRDEAADKITYSKSSGITYSIETQNEKWRKLVTIDTSVLSIPKGAKHLILSFLVDTDFNLPKGRISTRHELADDCWLEAAKVWVSGTTDYIKIEQEFSTDEYRKFVPVEHLKGFIETDSDFTFGTAEVYSESTTYSSDSAMFSSTSGFIAYRDGGDSNKGKAIAFSISGTDFTFGTEEIFCENAINTVSCAVFSSTSGSIVWCDTGDSNKGKAIAFTISGTDFSFGTEETFNNATTYNMDVASFSSTSGFIAYRDGGNSDKGTALAFTISGTDFTFGTEEIFNDATTYTIICAAFSSTSGFIVYRDYGNSNKGTSIAFTISGTDFSFGTEEVFCDNVAYYFEYDLLSASSGIIVYRDNTLAKGKAIAFTISGTDFTFGTEEVFCESSCQEMSVGLVGGNAGFIAFQDLDDSNKGKILAFTLSGTDFSFRTTETFASGVNHVSCGVLSSDSGFVLYMDAGNSNYGTAVAFTVQLPASSNPFMGVAF